MEQLITKLIDDFERGYVNRRQLIQSLTVAAATAAGAQAAPQASTGKGFKAVTVNHISYQVADYAKTRDFYADLFGMKITHDDGHQCYLSFGDTFLLPRNARRPGEGGRSGRGSDTDKAPEAASAAAAAPATPRVDHIAYTIADWNKDEVLAELKRRNLGFRAPGEPRPDTNNSFHIKDPDGFDLQISGKDMNAA